MNGPNDPRLDQAHGSAQPQHHHQPYSGPPAGPSYGGYPPVRGKSPAMAIVVATSAFAYLLFFFLYFTGGLDRMTGRIAEAPVNIKAGTVVQAPANVQAGTSAQAPSFPAELQGDWCWAGNTATESQRQTFAGSRERFVDVMPSETKSSERELVEISGNRYTLRNLANGRISVRSFRIDSAGKLQQQLLQSHNGKTDAQESEMQRCA